MPSPKVKRPIPTRVDDLRQMRDDLLAKMAAPGVNGQTYVAMGRLLVDVDAQLAELDQVFAAVPTPPREVTPLNDMRDELARRRASRAVATAEASAKPAGG